VFGIHSMADLMGRLLVLPLLILSLSFHEWAHAWSAYKLGDDTASMQGRLTLNPLAHIDLLGTILLPLMGIPFGWAKPVPVNPLRFRRTVTMKTGMMITAGAGPAANVALAVVCTVLYGLMMRFNLLRVRDGAVAIMLGQAIVLNVLLAVFNLLPIPPLDGSRIADGLMPYRLRPQWEQFSRYGAFLLLGVIIFGGSLLQGPISLVTDLLGRVVYLIAGR